MAKLLHKKDTFTDKDGKLVQYDKLFVRVELDGLECEVKIKVDNAHKDEVLEKVINGYPVEVIIETRKSRKDETKLLASASFYYESTKSYLGKKINSSVITPVDLTSAECLLVYLADSRE